MGETLTIRTRTEEKEHSECENVMLDCLFSSMFSSVNSITRARGKQRSE
jgi:hypothetical protein